MSPSWRVRYAVFTWVPEPMLAEWNEWHNRVHIPRVLQAPQMKGARKFRVTDTTLPGEWRPQYVTIYELESLDDFESYRLGPGAAMRAEYDEKYGDVGKTARLVMTEEAPRGGPA